MKCSYLPKNLAALTGAAFFLLAQNAICIQGHAQEIASQNKAEICASDGRPGSAYSRAHRLVNRPGIRGYELDHLVPICLGGADTDRNVAPEPLSEARRKDQLEAYACRMVCANRLDLGEAQSWFLVPGGWQAAYRRVFGEAP